MQITKTLKNIFILLYYCKSTLLYFMSGVKTNWATTIAFNREFTVAKYEACRLYSHTKLPKKKSVFYVATAGVTQCNILYYRICANIFTLLSTEKKSMTDFPFIDSSKCSRIFVSLLPLKWSISCIQHHYSYM